MNVLVHLSFITSLVVGVGGRAVSSAQVHAQALEESWEQSSKMTPVQRVIKLLKDMKAQLEEEASKESEMYDKMVCWCETGEKEKTAAIAAAEVKISDLESKIEAMSAKFGELATNIEALKDQIADDTAKLKEATAIREREAEEFRGEEKDMVQALTNLNNAIAVLSRHQGGASLLQLDGPLKASIRSVLREVTVTYDMMLGERSERKRGGASVSLLSVSSRNPSLALQEALGLSSTAFRELLPAELAESELAHRARELQGSGKAGAFLQSADKRLLPTAGSYSPQSDTIFGILTQMKEEFEANLSDEQKAEMKAIEDFEALKEAKTEQIAVGKEALDTMEEDHSANVKALSDAKEDLQLTTEQRSEDVEYLRNLRLTCQDLDHQWEERSKTRAEETKAVAEALAIITEDDNREHLMATIAFIQENSEMQAKMRARRVGAAGILRKAAGNLDLETDDLLAAWHGRGGPKVEGAGGSPKSRLSTLAVTVEIDDFAEVKKAMDKMVADLKAEQAEEVQFKAYCLKELRANEKLNYTKTEEKEDLEAKIESVEEAIQKYTEEIKEANTKIAENEKAMKEASQAREAENKEFQTIVADQRASQGILKKALGALKSFYDKKALLQQGQGSAQIPPVKFTDYSKNQGAVSAMGLIEQIISDSAALEKETTAGEAGAQADYEQFQKDTTAENKRLDELVVFKTKAISDAKVELSETQSEHSATVEELVGIAQTISDLHGECDFTLKNFDIRQRARLQEIEAIQAAKAFLSGEDKSGLVRQ